MPGGFNSIADINQRREVVGGLLVEPELALCIEIIKRNTYKEEEGLFIQ